MVSEEFRRQFDAVRDAFTARLASAAESHNIESFRACDEKGAPFAWVWSDEDFAHSGEVGDLESAKSFAANMIDQGMRFAFMVPDLPGEQVMWLTTWESPDPGPVWPPGLNPRVEEVHEGVKVRRNST